MSQQGPAFELLPEKISKKLTMEDVREFILYCLTEAQTPTWMRIANLAAVQKLVLVFAQGLDLTYFGYPANRANAKSSAALSEMDDKALAQKSLDFFNSCFSHCVVSKVSGTKGKIHNPLMNMLQCPVSNSQKEKRDKDRATSEYRISLSPL